MGQYYSTHNETEQEASTMDTLSTEADSYTDLFNSHLNLKKGNRFSLQKTTNIVEEVATALDGVEIMAVEPGDSKSVITMKMVEHEWIFFCTVSDDWLDLKSCFDKPKNLARVMMLKCINSWNTHRRFTRLTMDDENDLWLRADFPLSHENSTCLEVGIRDSLYAFGAAMLEYHTYVMTEADIFGKTAEHLDVKAHTEFYKCTEKDAGEKCALCLENFKEYESCLKLPCGHMFHRAEIERHLYIVPTCPLCRASITDSMSMSTSLED